MPKQSKPSTSRRFSEATKRLSETNGHHALTPSAGPIEKPLITQLKQKIAEHQQHHMEVPYEGSYTQQKPTVDRSDHDIMDLSVRKAPMAEGTSDWLRSVDGASNRFPCLHCGKIFSRESQLYLHSRVHEMETPTKSDKKKAKADRAVSPSGSSGNMAATSDNPRPFFCAECNVGFRIHGKKLGRTCFDSEVKIIAETRTGPWQDGCTNWRTFTLLWNERMRHLKNNL